MFRSWTLHILLETKICMFTNLNYLIDNGALLFGSVMMNGVHRKNGVGVMKTQPGTHRVPVKAGLFFVRFKTMNILVDSGCIGDIDPDFQKSGHGWRLPRCPSLEPYSTLLLHVLHKQLKLLSALNQIAFFYMLELLGIAYWKKRTV